MPTLSSPDPSIQQLLDTSPGLDRELSLFLEQEKYVTKKVLPGLWGKFLASPYGEPWREGTPQLLPLPTPTPAPYEPVVVAPTNGHKPTPQPRQDDLFDLLAQGLQDRLKPTTALLDEQRVQVLIDESLAKRGGLYTLTMRSPERITQLDTDLPVPYWFEDVYLNARAGVHTLLVGPKGCGKTMTAQLLAKALSADLERELPLYTISLSAGVDEGVLQGWLHPSRQGFWFEYVRSNLVRAYTEGGVVLLDELDASDPNALLIMNAALSNGHWDIPLRGEDALPIVKHEHCYVLAAANTHGHGADRVYAGRNQLDGATLDRFALGRISCDYDEALEQAAFAQEACTFGQRLRARCRAQSGWTRDVSTRNIADAHKKLAVYPQDRVWYAFFEDWKDGDLSRVGAVRDKKKRTVVLE